MSLLRRAAALTLDAAFPASCPGCGREGAPICPDCLPALDQRLDQPAGVPIGMPADIPAPLLQVEWCAPFSGVVRDALHALKYGGERRLAVPFGQALARRWGRAKVATRRRVAWVKARRGCSPCMALSSAIQWLKSMFMGDDRIG